MPSEGAPIQKINHIESSFLGLCKAVRNAIADSPTGRSLQSLYIAPTYICWVQIFALLFYNLITLLSLVMSMNDDHARIGILIVLPLFDGWGESAFPILICLIPELAPTAYMFVYLFWSTISIPAKWPPNVNRTVFSSLST